MTWWEKEEQMLGDEDLDFESGVRRSSVILTGACTLLNYPCALDRTTRLIIVCSHNDVQQAHVEFSDTSIRHIHPRADRPKILDCHEQAAWLEGGRVQEEVSDGLSRVSYIDSSSSSLTDACAATR